jgi:hypothetical protein
MKRFLIIVLAISVGVNIIFIKRKMNVINRWHEQKKLMVYRKISYEQGYEYFSEEFKKSYPEANLNNKYVIVYRWDSIAYDIIYREQMMALDSMAANFGKYKLEYIFVTEMEEGASTSFLKRNYDEYKNVKMLYGMDDFISGLHNIKGIKLVKPIVLSKQADSSLYFAKDLNFYAIIDPEGKVLFRNKIGRIVKDTAFLNKLKGLLPNKNLKILY